MKNSENIVLIGMPGVGKSTIGVLLAKDLRYGFIDTDLLIQSGERAGLQAIIREKGVAEFRRIEEKYGCAVHARSQVIATGGSMVYSPRAMKHLKQGGRAVWLSLSLDALKERLGDIDARGVIRGPGQTIDMLYAERLPLYREYHDLVIACDGLSPNGVRKQVLNMLKRENQF